MERAGGRQARRKSGAQRVGLGPKEKRRLVQLVACLALFAAVFFSKGMGRLGPLRSELASVLRANADFRAAFADLGWSVASGQPVEKTLNELWTDVFAAKKLSAPAAWTDGPLYRWALEDMETTGRGAAAVILEDREEGREDPMAASKTRQEAVSASVPEPEPEVVYADYTGPALPENTTMDRYALHLEETTPPVDGAITSGFGWREHPITGGEKFHYGVDLAVDTGTAVGAFAAGTVEYIGESDVYGQYLQIDHGNGVKSFYAHCSKLCVQQGEKVELGEKVAESGATGEVTGPHLHFELKRNGVRLDPAYYIESAS